MLPSLVQYPCFNAPTTSCEVIVNSLTDGNAERFAISHRNFALAVGGVFALVIFLIYCSLLAVKSAVSAVLRHRTLS